MFLIIQCIFSLAGKRYIPHHFGKKSNEFATSACFHVCSYLYCDEISLGADDALATMYAAKKYIMPHLTRACVNYLLANVDASNACRVLSHSRLFDEPQLMQRCLDVIDSRAEYVLQSDSFNEIDYQTLEQILVRDTLDAKERVVCAAAVQWAQAECIRQGRDTSPQQCREVLGEALYLIRFPAMALEDLYDVMEGTVLHNLLTKQEITGLLLYLTSDEKPKLRFRTNYRKRWIYKFMCCRRFTSSIWWDYRVITGEGLTASSFQQIKAYLWLALDFMAAAKVLLNIMLI